MNSWRLRQAHQVLENGGLIVYPTEAVMGLGCSPWDEAAVLRILRLKRRPAGKGLILVAAGLGQLLEVADFSGVADREAITRTWPGPVTWLIPARDTVPRWLTGKHDTLAVRVSAHPVVRRLCAGSGPLVSTSANPSGAEPARTQRRARAYFGENVDCYVPGGVGPDPRPSQIRDALTGRLLRG